MSAARVPGLRGRYGTSLVEMLLVLVLGGVVTTAAVSMIAPTNQLAREATESTEVEEGARSTLDLVSSVLRRVPAGGILVATRDSVVVAVPVAMGAFCANDGSRLTAYLGLGGRPLDAASIDGYALRAANGVWTFITYPGTSIFSGATPGRAACIAAGGGEAGTNADYFTFSVSTPLTAGSAALVWDRQTFRFAPSLLNPGTRAFFYGPSGAATVEVASQLDPDSRFEYRLRGSTTWQASIGSSQVANIDVVRVIVGGTYGSAGTLSREVPLLNAD